MQRIYIDSNIFRFLKKQDIPLYQELYKKIIDYSDRLIYYYSYAHLADLSRDKSEEKYDDLIFMHNIVNSNYLATKWKETQATIQIASPLEAFKSLNFDESFSDVIKPIFNLKEEFPSNKEFPELTKLTNALDTLMEIKLPFNLKTNIEKKDDKSQEAWRNLIPNPKDTYSLKEWMQDFGGIIDNFTNDEKTYKSARRHSIETIQHKKYEVNINDIDFDTSLKNTPLQKYFTEFVQEILKAQNKDINSSYDFYITAFISLNLLGVDEEKNKKVKFPNTMNDAFHSFYAAYCDYLISDDEGLLVKSKVLYKLLGIDTKVMHVKEFNNQIFEIARPSYQSPTHFINALKYDLEQGLIVKNKILTDFKRIKPFYPHFSYFNRVDVYDNSEIILLRLTNNYSNFSIVYKEIEGIVNNLFKLFGKDNNNKGIYTNDDKKELSTKFQK